MVAQSTISCITTKFGAGRHTWDIIGKGDLSIPLKMMLSITVTWGLANTFTKLSILFFYRRICDTFTISRVITITIYAVAAWGFVIFWLGIFECRPLPASWTFEHVPGESCTTVTLYKAYV